MRYTIHGGRFVEHGLDYTIMLEPELRITRPTGYTVDHDPIPADALEFSVSGLVYHATLDGSRDRRYSDCVSAGQIVDDLRRVGTTRAVRLAELWDRWHLNGMRANCSHMPTRKYTDGLECPARLPMPADAETGDPYVSGTRWLYEPIPADTLAEIRRLFRLPTPDAPLVGETMPRTAHDVMPGEGNDR